MDEAFQELLKNDPRYKAEAYGFVFESLEYAQNRLKLGKKCESESFPNHLLENHGGEEESAANHITGQDLCQASRLYALDMYGFMAKTVLGNWGIHETGDVGELVYNMIKIGRMRKTLEDKREDFDNVFDFSTAFDEEYQINLRKKKR